MTTTATTFVATIKKLSSPLRCHTHTCVALRMFSCCGLPRPVLTCSRLAQQCLRRTQGTSAVSTVAGSGNRWRSRHPPPQQRVAGSPTRRWLSVPPALRRESAAERSLQPEHTVFTQKYDEGLTCVGVPGLTNTMAPVKNIFRSISSTSQ